jgi:hypothetical protein
MKGNGIRPRAGRSRVAAPGRAWFDLPMTQGKAEQRAAREARLQKALRENLRRRKAQARGRTTEEGVSAEVRESETDEDQPTSSGRRS